MPRSSFRCLWCRLPRLGKGKDIVGGLARLTGGAEDRAITPERKALISERDGLADRQWLGTILDDFLAEIERIKKIAALKKAEQDTKTNKITGKSTEVAEALVTNALRAQFAIEVGRMASPGWRSN